MDSNNPRRSVQQRKSPKKAKKSKPIKIVYISNPMMVKTSASEFRALVQELTGQNAEYPDPTKFPATDYNVGGSNHLLGHQDHDLPKSGDHDLDSIAAAKTTALAATETSSSREQAAESSSSVSTWNELFDEEIFMPQTIESFSGILPSSVWYDSHVDMLRSLDAM
ncbi:hypothetical protein UlMin_006292 [Ulmus minor]